MIDYRNQRKFPRLKPPKDTVCIIRDENNNAVIGKPIDISKGGIAVEYNSRQARTQPSAVLDIFLPEQFRLRELQCRLVYDILDPVFESEESPARRSGFEFVSELSQEQIDDLIEFLTRYCNPLG